MINVKIAVEHKKTERLTVKYKDITLGELAAELNIDRCQIGAILVDCVPKRMNDKVEDNCEIYILPILAGG